MYDLNSAFNIKQHKAHFIDYLEVVVFPDGHIEYATPSHQEKLIKVACDLNNWTRNQLNKECPEEYYFDFMTWLCNITGCIALWCEYAVLPEDKSIITSAQKNSIQELIDNGLYEGKI